MSQFGAVNTTVSALNTAFGDHAAAHAVGGVDPLPGIPYSRFIGNDPAMTTSVERRVGFTLDAQQGPTYPLSTGTTGIANSRISIPAGFDGIYVVVAQVYHNGSAAGNQRFASIEANGARIAARSDRPHQFNQNRLNLHGMCYLQQDEFIEMMLFHDGGGTLSNTWYLALARIGS